MIDESRAGKCLCEYVCRVAMRGNPDWRKSARLDVLSNEVVTKINVFRAKMISGLGGEGDGPGVVRK